MVSIPSIVAQPARKALTAVGSAKEAYTNAISEPIAKFIGKVSPTRPSQKLIETFAKFKNPSGSWSHLASFAITFFYLKNTYQSDKIDEDRKLPLMINNLSVTLASSAAAMAIDAITDKPLEGMIKGYVQKRGDNLLKDAKDSIIKNFDKHFNKGAQLDLKEMTLKAKNILPEDKKQLTEGFKEALETLKNSDLIKRAIKEKIIQEDDLLGMLANEFGNKVSHIQSLAFKTKTLTVFTLTVRFLVTVLMVPVIGKIVKFVNKKLGKETSDKKDDNNGLPNSSSWGMNDFTRGLEQQSSLNKLA